MNWRSIWHDPTPCPAPRGWRGIAYRIALPLALVAGLLIFMGSER